MHVRRTYFFGTVQDGYHGILGEPGIAGSGWSGQTLLSQKEKSSMYIIGAKEIVEKILPVVDNFERGLAQAQEGDAFADGMKMIYKQLTTTLDELGVKPIEAVGKEFNPDFHNAVMHVEDEEVGENIVVEEFQKGYTYKDFVVRHSMVKVAN